jgi:hypothetical protein
MSESQHQVKVLKSSASSATRILAERTTLARNFADSGTLNAMKQVAKPNSISRTLRVAGVALMLSPDPFTDVPGAIMLGASLATRNKDPLSPASVFAETRKLLAEMGSFF